MKIFGLQKMTLLDFPGEIACTVFTAGCNMRCPFCHNASLVTDINPADAIEEEEFFAFLNKRKGLLSGVAITGGEPLMQPDIAKFMKRVKELGFKVKLDTNGTFPERLACIIDEGLVDYIAMDIKNSEQNYPKTVGVPDFNIAPVKKSIELIIGSGVAHEFRTTVVDPFHTVESIFESAEMIKGCNAYFLQGFVDSGNLIGENVAPVPKEIMEKMREKAAQIVINTSIRGV